MSKKPIFYNKNVLEDYFITRNEFKKFMREVHSAFIEMSSRLERVKQEVEDMLNGLK